MRYTKDTHTGFATAQKIVQWPTIKIDEQKVYTHFFSLFQAEKEEAEEKTQIKVDLRESQDSGAGAARTLS